MSSFKASGGDFVLAAVSTLVWGADIEAIKK